jgi:hypothetical protein
MDTILVNLHAMIETDASEVLLRNLDKEITIYCYDYEKGEAEYLGDSIRLWNLIVIMYILSKNIQVERMIEKLNSIIKYPKVLVFLVKSLKKILYIWLKDYDLHCILMMKLCPEIYNPKKLLSLYHGDRFYKNRDNSQ